MNSHKPENRIGIFRIIFRKILRFFPFGSKNNGVDSAFNQHWSQRKSLLENTSISDDSPPQNETNLYTQIKQLASHQKYLTFFLSISLFLQLLPYLQNLKQRILPEQPKQSESQQNVNESSISISETKPVAAGNLEIGMSLKGKKFKALIIDLDKQKLELFFNSKTPKTTNNFRALNEQLQKENKRLTFATNAGMFGKDHRPLGVHVENGKTIQPILIGNKNAEKGNFFLLPNAVFQIENNIASITDTSLLADKKIWTSTNLATQSGPALLLDGIIHSEFKEDSANLNIRSGIGIINKKKIVFIISDDEISFYDFAQIFKEQYKCLDALYLDGLISKMYLPELNGEVIDDSSFGGVLAITEVSNKSELKK